MHLENETRRLHKRLLQLMHTPYCAERTAVIEQASKEHKELFIAIQEMEAQGEHSRSHLYAAVNIKALLHPTHNLHLQRCRANWPCIRRSSRLLSSERRAGTLQLCKPMQQAQA